MMMGHLYSVPFSKIDYVDAATMSINNRLTNERGMTFFSYLFGIFDISIEYYRVDIKGFFIRPELEMVK